MKTFFVTTPIYYLNSNPHIGSAYATMVADMAGRMYRMQGYDVKFLTGTDEHGQKIEEAAQKAKMPTREFVDMMSLKFRELVDFMGYKPSYFDYLRDNFMRTTKSEHIKVVQDVWRRLVENGWIYRGRYSGWYAVSDEAYYTESDLIKQPDGSFKTDLGKDVEWREEDSYFFRLGAFQKALLALYDHYPQFVKPDNRRAEIVSFVSGLSAADFEAGKEPVDGHLQDLSVSRNNFSWGIKIPCDENGQNLLDNDGRDWLPDIAGEEKHVIYVWFDALFNYVSALGGIGAKDYETYWASSGTDGNVQIRDGGAEVGFAHHATHVVGKEILRPHTAYWPAFLMAYSYSYDEVKSIGDYNKFIDGVLERGILPRTVFVHGFWTNEGQKISKSLNNGVYPQLEVEWMYQDFNVGEETAIDYLKYYLTTDMTFGSDGDYSRERLVNRVNSELVNKVGNLAKRVLDMIYKNCGGKIPDVPEDGYENLAYGHEYQFIGAIRNFDFRRYVGGIIDIAESANKYMEDRAPWELGKKGETAEMERVLYAVAEALRHVAILLQPVCSYLGRELCKQLNLEEMYGLDLDASNVEGRGVEFKYLSKEHRLRGGMDIPEPKILFPRLT